MKKILGILACSTALLAQEADRIKTPEQIQAELDQALRDFNTAKELFIPWYTGPLITGSANNVPEGKINIQPYLYLNDQYAQFNDNRKSIGVPDIFTIQPLFVYQYGFTDFMDSTLILTGFFRFREDEYADGFGDLGYTLGFQLVDEKPYVPAVRFTVGETFPTGKYRNFNPAKAAISSTGGGVFATQFGLFVSKIFWWIKLHPLRLRFATTYTLPNHRAHVTGFNSYGGGFGADAKVCVGHGIQADIGIEVSLTQKWVFALDIAYDYGFQTTATGNFGTSADGTPAFVGGPSNDQLSLAPAIEYNVSSTGGFIGGVWFSVTGRNSANFVAGVLSYTQLF